MHADVGRSAVPAQQNDDSDFPVLTGQPFPAKGFGNSTDPPILHGDAVFSRFVQSTRLSVIIKLLPDTNNSKTDGATKEQGSGPATGYSDTDSRAAANFNSGILPNGSRAGLVSLFAGASVKQKGTKIIPLGKFGSTRAASSIRPRLVST